MLDALDESVFDDVQARLHADERANALTDPQRRTLLLSALSAVLDHDQNGDPFVFHGSPGCPHCGSTAVASFVETDEPVSAEAAPATHVTWDTLPPASRDALVRSTLDRRLDGA